MTPVSSAVAVREEIMAVIIGLCLAGPGADRVNSAKICGARREMRGRHASTNGNLVGSKSAASAAHLRMSISSLLSPHVETLGYVAAFLTTSAFLPQVIRTWQSGGEQLSWGMIGLFGAGVFLWLVYGLLSGSTPIVAANALTVAQVAVIAALKATAVVRRKDL